MVGCLEAQKAEKLHKVNPQVLRFQIKGTGGIKKDLLVIAKCPDLAQKGILHKL